MFETNSLLIGQDIDSKYKYLAQYIILKYALIDQGQPSSNPTLQLLPSVLEDVTDIITTNDFRYKVELIDTLGDYEIIGITDSTNFNLHVLVETVWAVDQNESIYGNCINISDIGFEKFVNEYLFKRIDEYNKLSIIRIYNKLELGNRRIDLFYPDKNMELFKLLEDEYRLKRSISYNKLNIDKTYYGSKIYTYSTFYRESSGNQISYYHIMFEFNWKCFKVTRTLLYKVKV